MQTKINHHASASLLNKCINGMERVLELHTEGKTEDAQALAFQLHSDASLVLGGTAEVCNLIDAFHASFARYWQLSNEAR